MSTSQAALFDALYSGITVNSSTTDHWKGPVQTPVSTGHTGALVWVGYEKGGRQGGRQAVALGALEHEESYLATGQAIGQATGTDNPAIASARSNAYAVLALVETYLAATDPTCGGNVRFAEIENLTLKQTWAPDQNPTTRVATITFGIRAHKRI